MVRAALATRCQWPRCKKGKPADEQPVPHRSCSYGFQQILMLCGGRSGSRIGRALPQEQTVPPEKNQTFTPRHRSADPNPSAADTHRSASTPARQVPGEQAKHPPDAGASRRSRPRTRTGMQQAPPRPASAQQASARPPAARPRGSTPQDSGREKNQRTAPHPDRPGTRRRAPPPAPRRSDANPPSPRGRPARPAPTGGTHRSGWHRCARPRPKTYTPRADRPACEIIR